jgi:hypothetical protein
MIGLLGNIRLLANEGNDAIHNGTTKPETAEHTSSNDNGVDASFIARTLTLGRGISFFGLCCRGNRDLRRECHRQIFTE